MIRRPVWSWMLLLPIRELVWLRTRLLAPGVAVPVIAAGPTTDMDVGTADGLLPDVADFDPTSAWGDGDEVTAAAPDGADFDPTSLDSVWVGGDGATAAIPTNPPRFRNSGAVGRGFRSLDRNLLWRVCS